MKIISIYSVFWMLLFFERKASTIKCSPSQKLLNGNCIDCPVGYFGYECGAKCFGTNYGLGCKFTCKCTLSEECHHINGCRTRTTYSLELTDYIETTSSVIFSSTEDTSQDEIQNPGSSISPTHSTANSNEWILNYIIVMVILLAGTFTLSLLRTQLSRCNKAVSKTHDEVFGLRVTKHSVKKRREGNALVQPPTIDIPEDVYSEIRESQMIGRVFSLTQINTLMNGSIVVSTGNKSRSSDIYNHLDHSISTDNVDKCFECEYAHAHSVGLMRGMCTVANPILELDRQEQ